MEKCTKADEGIYRYPSQHNFTRSILHESKYQIYFHFSDVLSQTDLEGESTNLSFSYQVSLFWSLNNFPWHVYLFAGSFARKAPLKREVKFNSSVFLHPCIISVVNPTSLHGFPSKILRKQENFFLLCIFFWTMLVLGRLQT